MVSHGSRSNLRVCPAHACRACQVDRLYDWKARTDAPIRDTLDAQERHVGVEFEQRLNKVKGELMEQVSST
jgi:translation initiation factor IF-2